MAEGVQSDRVLVKTVSKRSAALDQADLSTYCVLFLGKTVYPHSDFPTQGNKWVDCCSNFFFGLKFFKPVVFLCLRLW